MPLWILVAATPALLATVAWAVIRLEQFVYLTIPAAMVFPAPVAQPAGAIIAVADLLTVGAVLAWIVANSVTQSPRVWFRDNPLLLPTVIFVAYAAGSLAWSADPSLTAKSVLQLAAIVVVLPLLFSSVASSLKTVDRGLQVFLAVCLGLGMTTIIATGSNIGRETVELPGGLNKNATGSFTSSAAVAAYVMALNPLASVRRRFILNVVSLITFFATFATLSRGSLLGALVGVCLAALVLRRRRAVTLTLVGILVATFLLTIGTRAPTRPDESGSYDSSVVRIYSFRDAVDKIGQDPFIGTGHGTYYLYIPELDIGIPDPNNLFLLTGAELGMLGLAALLFLLIRFVQAFIRAGRLPLYHATLAAACGAVAVSRLVHFQVDVTWTRGTASLAFAMMGAMLAVTRLARPKEHDVDLAVPESRQVAAVVGR